ncbi:dynamin family protein [Stutzerimonas nitrititolerans]|uniref:dynamin family protein n=1 Tax=Stutzerimonas nitrititolerans TaxID=2482751 RepID=UPI002899F7B4|nr:dynamin family protein [Stutzerimonas nitrititolerans]
MSDLLLVPRFEPALTRLKRIWPWGRKALIEQLRQHVEEADEHTLRMQALRQRIEAELAGVSAELGATTSDLERLQALHGQLQAEHSAQTQQLRERTNAYAALAQAHKLQRGELEQLQRAHASLEDAHAQLQAAHQRLEEEHGQLQATAELVERRYRLVCNILNGKPAENPALSELKSWFAGEFARDVQRLELPADVTSMVLEQAQSISLHVELLSDSPALRTKSLVAVAGGFSSGKSSFVTSFMHREHSQLLAKGIQPVTAIPTYVMPGRELSIYGHTRKGAHVALTKDEYAQLTHDFIANMGFNVKEVMPHVVIEAPMPEVQHLAFIDMPGYDPAASDTADTAADHGIASAVLSEADAVIWLVALDTNGTLPANDLEFLLQHADDRPLYVVLNKADLRPMSTLQDVIEEIRDHLEDSGIQYEGICAYSSTLGKELLHEGKSLSEVMQEWDHSTDAALMLYKEFETMVQTLDEYANRQLHKVENVNELAHSIELDILQMVGSESKVFRAAQNRLGQLKELAESILGVEKSEAHQRLENMRMRGHQLLQDNLRADYRSPRQDALA